MKDKFVRWDDPPTLDGMTGHAVPAKLQMLAESEGSRASKVIK
jgi:hypothetical protein